MGYQEQLSNEVVKVLELGPSGARCVTQYGSEIVVRWGANLPDPAPAVGQMWLVSKYSVGQWSFSSRLHSGSYSVMRYEMELDARMCVGTERVVCDDLAGIGLDGVFLRVADGGVVMWDSEHAESFGLRSFGDHVTQIVDRLDGYGIPVTFVIGSGLWSDTSDDAHGLYQQRVLKDGIAERVGVLSWQSAAEAISVLIGELYERYGSVVRGVCIGDVASAGESGDFSIPMRSRYFSLFGHEPYDDMASRPADDQDDWWERRKEWQSVNSSALGDFVVRIKSVIGDWPVSATVPSIAVMNSGSGRKTGRLSTLLDDQFSGMGWANVIVPIECTRQSDPAGELRSFEFCLAQAMRFSSRSTFFARLDVGTIRQPEGVFEVLSKYNCKNVLLGDYAKWRELSDQQVIDMQEAMGRYRVVDMNVLPFVGLLESHDSRDRFYYSLEDNDRYCRAMESMASVLLDRLPHRVKVLYDDDMESDEYLRGIAAVVVFCGQGISDDAVTKVVELVNGGITDVAVIGPAGGGADSAGSIRVLSAFGAKAYGDLSFGNDVALVDLVDVADTVWTFDGSSTGTNVIVGDALASSMAQDASLTWREARCPVIIKDRAVLMAMDVTVDDALVDAAASIAAYSMGRNG